MRGRWVLGLVCYVPILAPGSTSYPFALSLCEGTPKLPEGELAQNWRAVRALSDTAPSKRQQHDSSPA